MRQKSTGQVPTAVSGYGRLQVDPWSRLESSCRLPRPTFSRDWLCQPGRHKRPAPAWRSAPSRATATLGRPHGVPGRVQRGWGQGGSLSTLQKPTPQSGVPWVLDPGWDIPVPVPACLGSVYSDTFNPLTCPGSSVSPCAIISSSH